MKAHATYVYCLVAGRRRPAVKKTLRGLPGTGAIRLLDVTVDRDARGRTSLKQWLVVGDAPLARYGEQALNSQLTDLDWVTTAAVAHEAVVEQFLSSATALLPMKLFTIFLNDDRAADHVRDHRAEIDEVLRRVTDHEEWGVRVTLDRSAAAAAEAAAPAGRSSGAGYLSRKKAARDRAVELATNAREEVARLYDQLAARASEARRRTASELPVSSGPLLLDAAFLVRRSKVRGFTAAVRGEMKALAGGGYHVALTGPWPPYSFLKN